MAVLLLFVAAGITYKLSVGSSARALSATAPGIPNPCTLVSSTAVSPILGGLPTARALTGTSGGRFCTWNGPTLHSYAGPQHTTLIIAITRTTKAKFKMAAPDHALGVPFDKAIYVWHNGYGITIATPNIAPTAGQLRTLAAKIERSL